ncbi:dysbindin-like [Polyodon spathula]|uniref:dysbindin-like n=1 Tax=Polyodon spathula TaxID=7913 RepID=UPI001B7F5CA3|nr:dysbindin-like [Polyodon spathula]
MCVCVCKREREKERESASVFTEKTHCGTMSSESNSHSKRLPSETEHAQRVLEPDHAQQLKLRERQRFFEEVFQHDIDVYLSAAHLQIEQKRPPIGSISSMEVNVDMLEQVELLDISDQEAFDVFFSSGVEEGSVATALADDDIDVYQDEITLEVPGETKSRTSSTSSTSTDPYSLDTSEEGAETPVVQSDNEDVQADTELFL